MAAAVRSSRPLILLIALLLYILVAPQVEAKIVRIVLQLGLVGACVHMASDSRRHLVSCTAQAVPAVALVVAGEMTGNNILLWSGYVFLLTLYVSIILLMLRRIFRAPRVTLDEIGLALCTYVLLGMLWLLFYTPLAASDLDAHFAFNTPPEPGAVNHALTYFSYVTLTTLGYGDISPISPLARSLAVLEALTGVLFLAVLISRLVGNYAARRGGEAEG